VDFADDMLPGLDLCRQKDHGMGAVANGAISDDIAVPEELGNVRKNWDHVYRTLLTFTSRR
jgi:hypothetical protein